MELLTFIIYLIILLAMVKFILSIIKTSSYIKILKQISKEMDSKEYQNSDTRKERIKQINKLGLEQALENIIVETRSAAMKSLKMRPKEFQNKKIRNEEEQYKSKYSKLHFNPSI